MYVEVENSDKMCCRTDLYDGVDGARFLTEAAVDALGHVDVVASGSPTSVSASLRLDRDRLQHTESRSVTLHRFKTSHKHLRRTNGFAQLAGDAALLAGRVASQGVLASEAGTERSLLERVVDRGGLLQKLAHADHEA